MYRLSSVSISRGKGQSAIASLAYRTGEKLLDEKLGKTFDYTNKDVSHHEILLPANANDKYSDVEKLANAVEKKETRDNSELLKEYILTLPLELNKEQQIKMVKDFANKQFVEKGLACSIAFHDLGGSQPHCHLTTTTRSFNELGELGNKERFFKDTGFLIKLRQEWAKTINLEYELAGIKKVVSSETLRKQGLNLQPINSNYKNREDREIHIEKIKEKNRKQILKEPQQVANFLTYNKAVFTDKELQECIIRYVGEKNLKECYKAVFSNSNTLLLDKDLKQFTSAEYQLKEIKLFNSVDILNKEDFSKKIDSNILKSISKDMDLSVEQKSALYYATRTDSNIKNIQGFAGAGKSYTMKAISDSYQKAGYSCRGLALSGVISDNLGNDCKIKSSTIASFLYTIEKDREKLSQKTVLFIDEASMIGTRDYQKILELAEKNNCKVISVGDDNQLQAIQSGGVFRGICKNTSSLTLSEIRRQQDHKDRLATLNFSTGKTKEALEHYNEKNCIKFHDKKLNLVKEISDKYLNDMKNNPGQKNLILAHANKDVAGFNKHIHDTKKELGELGNSKFVNGIEYSEKDRFVFLDNNHSLGVKNGTIGTIETIKNNEFQIRIDTPKNEPEKKVNFNIKDYNKFTHAYALTIHKSQGVTVDKTQLYMDKNTNNNLALVGCSRHKESLQIHCLQKNKDNPNGFENVNDLIKLAERKQVKELVQDKLIKLETSLSRKGLNTLSKYSKSQKLEQKENFGIDKNLIQIIAINERVKDLEKLSKKSKDHFTNKVIDTQLTNSYKEQDKLFKTFFENHKSMNQNVLESPVYKQVMDINKQNIAHQKSLEQSRGYSRGISM
tara:strand:- start:687 stop:3218 length:2532 start_codon:yes stop_codon:yes gene_type:complete